MPPCPPETPARHRLCANNCCPSAVESLCATVLDAIEALWLCLPYLAVSAGGCLPPQTLKHGGLPLPASPARSWRQRRRCSDRRGGRGRRHNDAASISAAARRVVAYFDRAKPVADADLVVLERRAVHRPMRQANTSAALV